MKLNAEMTICFRLDLINNPAVNPTIFTPCCRCCLDGEQDQVSWSAVDAVLQYHCDLGGTVTQRRQIWPMPEPEMKTIESKIVYQNKWMTVKEEVIERHGGSTGLYGIVSKPDFAVIAAVEDDQVYLVQQYRYPVRRRYWELPQGSWEERSIEPLELARAELREETGIVARQIQHVGHLFLAYGFSDQGYHIYYATDLIHHSQQLNPEETDLISKAFRIAEVEKMISEGAIKDATTVAVFGLLKQKGLI